jgi:hypothetical protein
VQSEAWLQAAQMYETVLVYDPERSNVLETLAVLYQKQVSASTSKN